MSVSVVDVTIERVAVILKIAVVRRNEGRVYRHSPCCVFDPPVSHPVRADSIISHHYGSSTVEGARPVGVAQAIDVGRVPKVLTSGGTKIDKKRSGNNCPPVLRL